MALKKKSTSSFRRVVGSLVIIFFLLVGVGITVSAVQEKQGLSSFAAEILRLCQKVPARNYNVKVETYAPTKWEVFCPIRNGRWSGEIPATTIPFGYHWVPTIRKGDTYTIETTLKNICTSPRVEASWNNVCQVCKYIDCSKIKISGKWVVRRIDCLLGAYRAEGQGNVNVTYQGSGLGSCTAKATYSGKLTGTFVVGVKE